MSTLAATDVVVRETILSLVARGKTLATAAKMAGTSLRSVNALRKADPEFEEDLKEAFEVMVSRVDDVRYERAIDGDAKMMEMFYREFKPHVAAAQGAFGRHVGAAGHSGPVFQVQQMSVAIVQNIVDGDGLEPWLRAMGPVATAAIEATAIDNDD